MKNVFLTNRFFLLFAAIIALFVLSFSLEFLFPVAQTVLILAIILVLVDGMLLFGQAVRVKIRRRLPKVFSLGDANRVRIYLRNRSKLKLYLTVIDELPLQFQRRDFSIQLNLNALEEKELTYDLQPIERGEYTFGAINVFVENFIGLLQRRLVQDFKMEVPVYPSIIQMKQFELKAFDRVSLNQGIKKIRRLGHSYEFEQIKNYVRGDDYRSINWKASSRRGQLMVNQYEDERARSRFTIS